MYCTGCGVELRQNDRFCSQCGKTAAREDMPYSQRRLVRPMREKTIGGVCAGFARYLDIDVVLMRIIWLCAGIFFGLPFIAYIVCWIVMPPDWGAEGAPAKEPARTETVAESGQHV